MLKTKSLSPWSPGSSFNNPIPFLTHSFRGCYNVHTQYNNVMVSSVPCFCFLKQCNESSAGGSQWDPGICLFSESLGRHQTLFKQSTINRHWDILHYYSPTSTASTPLWQCAYTKEKRRSDIIMNIYFWFVRHYQAFLKRGGSNIYDTRAHGFSHLCRCSAWSNPFIFANLNR